MKTCINGEKNVIAVFKAFGNSCLCTVEGCCNNLCSVFSFKLLFKELFNTCFSDNIVHAVAVFFQFGIFLGTYNARNSDYMRSKGSVGIFTVVTDFNIDTLIKSAVFLDHRGDLIGNVGCKNIRIGGIKLIDFHFIADRCNFSSVGF